MTFPSARPLAAVAALACAAALMVAEPALAESKKPGPVADAPILDLVLPTKDFKAPVDDISVATESESGSLTDAEDSTQRTVTLAADVLFDFDKATLSGKSTAALKEAAAILKRDAGGKTVTIDGFTDAKGDAAYNKKLSGQRAAAVKKELASLVTGADVTFVTSGRGSADPVAPDQVDGRDNPGGRAKNRRVEIRFAR